MSKRIKLAPSIALLLLSFLPGVVPAQTIVGKPLVQVVFRVQAIRYQTHFANTLESFEQQAAVRFAKSLNERFAFLNFTTDQQPIKLTIALAYASPSETCAQDANCSKETVFNVQLEQPDTPPVAYNRWIYLKQQDFFLGLGEMNAEIENLERVGFARLNSFDITAKLFSHVQLSPNARLIWKPSGGAGNQASLAGVTVPLPANLLCADQHSVLVMQSEIPQEFTAGSKAELAVDAQGPFFPPDNASDETWKKETGNLFGIPAADPPHERTWDAWAPLSSADRDLIKIKGIFMYQYRHMDTGCSAAISPSELAPNEGQR